MVGAGGLALVPQLQPSTAPPPPPPPPNNPPHIAAAPPPRFGSPRPPRPLLHRVASMEEFKQAHARFVKLGQLDRVGGGDLLSACALSAWGSLAHARSIFDALDERGAFHFNTMIRAYVDSSDPNTALCLYQEMVEQDVEPDGFTFPFALKACALLSSAVGEGAQLHASAIKFGFGADAYAQNGLISLYGRRGEIELSRKVFEQLGSNRTVASWSALLAAHARAGLWGECLRLFSSMTTTDRGGMRPDESSIVSALSSCARLGALRAGRSIHSSLERNFAGLNVAVRTALLDMYMKCGCPEKGMLVFDSMRDKNAWAYGVLISGLAAHGAGEKALEAFEEMSRDDGIEPDDAVFVGVLSACSRAGLVEEGLRRFDRMRLERRVEPNAQHYGCVVDLLGRAGKLDDALALVKSMPVGLPTDVAWRSLLSACKVHGNLELAECAMRSLVELGCAKAGDYVILSNMYSKMRRWDDAARVRTEMADLGLSQVPGVSRVEVKGRVYTFVSQDRSHPRCDGVYEMLYQMEWQLRFEGYKPDTSEVSSLLGAADDEAEKLQVVCRQSQKLAIAFALLNTSQGEPIRVFTNLRMSSECHAYTKLISKIFDRDVVVRDRNRFHRFRQGSCSCQDFW
ncbi:pentatricopeptide repeat-containing protein [Iris pallida]|uniref:Pentatricopeptide repeat-containing protein n=1 Tax=Iris pallida TaxID=29817 RepID=A0AAX6GZN2_IRIPA|nr:pentatricopeptide repeat-containing protein [Iris pallida]